MSSSRIDYGRFPMLVSLLCHEGSRLTIDLIIVLRDGSVAEQGSHEELMKIEGGVYRRLWEAQLTESTSAPILQPSQS